MVFSVKSPKFLYCPNDFSERIMNTGGLDFNAFDFRCPSPSLRVMTCKFNVAIHRHPESRGGKV